MRGDEARWTMSSAQAHIPAEWCVNKDALSGTTGMLHKAVMLLIDPNYTRSKQIHRPRRPSKLDSRRINLRIAGS
jgi:hypothetical protein